MSNIHAYMDACDRMAPASQRTLMDAIKTLHAKVAGLATDLFARFQHRRMMQRIARFPDHRLHDTGFERDWDGSILPKQR